MYKLLNRIISIPNRKMLGPCRPFKGGGMASLLPLLLLPLSKETSMVITQKRF